MHTQSGGPAYLTALANGSIDITNTATWTVLDSTGTNQTANFTLSYVSGSGEGFMPNSTVPSGTYTVKATYTSVVGSASLIVVNP